MISAKFLIGVAMLWVLCQLTALSLSGLFLGASFVETLNNGTAFNSVQVSSAGVLTLPKLGPLVYISFIPTMLSWNYPLLANEWSILKIPLWAISFGVVIGLTSLVAAALQGIFPRFSGN